MNISMVLAAFDFNMVVVNAMLGMMPCFVIADELPIQAAVRCNDSGWLGQGLRGSGVWLPNWRHSSAGKLDN